MTVKSGTQPVLPVEPSGFCGSLGTQTAKPHFKSVLKGMPESMKLSVPRFYDTTLRDGNQAIGVNFSVDDKIKIARRLSDFGIDYIEGGWPNITSPAEIEFFRRIKNEQISSAIAVFGITRKPDLKPEDDRNLRTLLSAGADYITLMGKAWTLHVEKVLGTSLRRNLQMVSDSTGYLYGNGCNVIFDAEHFYDGYKENPSYAINIVASAEEAGAREIVLCDTRGGTTPTEIYEITREVKREISKPVGIHAHNDRGLATVNSLFALMAGAEHVQGTINGLGERCGNANLIEVIGNLAITYGVNTGVDISKLSELSSYVYEISNVRRNNYQPFVGRFAFAHKGGIHGHAVLKCPEAYESFDPTLVGNTRSIAVSSQTGLANIVEKAKEFGFNLKKGSFAATRILREVKEKEAQGYHYENAGASLNLLYARALGVDLKYFDLLNWRAFVLGDGRRVSAESTVKLKMGSQALIAAAEGNGPVNAFDIALKRALKTQHPELSKVRLVGYRVREINVEKGTAAAVQVFAEFKANTKRWSTIGVSPNILKASEEALIDGYLYYLHKIRGSEGSAENPSVSVRKS